MIQQPLWAIREEITREEMRCVLRKEAISPSLRAAEMEGHRLLPPTSKFCCAHTPQSGDCQEEENSAVYCSGI